MRRTLLCEMLPAMRSRARPLRRAGVASLVAAAALLASAPALPAAPAAHARRPAPSAWRPDARAAIAFARTRSGTVRFAVRTEQHAWGWRATLGAPSASVVKAMLLVAYLDRPSVRGRALQPADYALLVPMIRWSDNDAASRVLALVGPGGVYSVAKRAGMRHFVLERFFWGRSRIDAADQSRFFLHLDARVVPRHRATAMHLLATIVPQQRWGIGQVRPRGWALYFKGGWGFATGGVEHQVALLRRGHRRVAVAVLTTGSPSHAYATATLRGVFARLLRGL